MNIRKNKVVVSIALAAVLSISVICYTFISHRLFAGDYVETLALRVSSAIIARRITDVNPDFERLLRGMPPYTVEKNKAQWKCNGICC